MKRQKRYKNFFYLIGFLVPMIFVIHLSWRWLRRRRATTAKHQIVSEALNFLFRPLSHAENCCCCCLYSVYCWIQN